MQFHCSYSMLFTSVATPAVFAGILETRTRGINRQRNLSVLPPPMPLGFPFKATFFFPASFLPPFLSVFLSFCVSPSLPPSYYACHICHIYFIYVCIWCGRFHVSPRPWLASWKSWTVFTAPNARDLVIGKMLATNVLPTCYPLATRRYHQWLCLLRVFAHSFWFKVWSRTCHTLGLSVIKWPTLKFGERLPYFCWPQKLGRDQIAVRFRAKRMIDLSIGAWEALRSIAINIACVSRIFHSKIRHVHLIQNIF